ncbi:3-deoxy-D-manno-octulosonic acid transferase [Flavihumibacter petaseus]|uniref:3-deoxy-D-manno-octulosonic acid transferase n=1 Tax=Flavihumibacter petaseus NBRC 106054 TaxID=1220578 RepID=A0A0E9MUV7_9BACT|nr:glycosyltransferase N-terminal domain-containing protein [Flavihumibacter petaseus]GAO41216.1 putative glycosyltransferase [Flavihumibacter petaseus NBRC 106054]
MSLLLYNIFILLYRVALGIASSFHPKARQWVAGRRNWQEKLAKDLEFRPDAPLIWMHCASLGEFEQGRPLLEHIREKYPHYRILISFFSPSGYEIRKNWEGADIITYLPVDNPGNARRFLDLTKPALVLWVRYEFWYHYLNQLKSRQIPVILVSGLFRESQPFFKWYGNLYRHLLHCFDQLFVQEKDSVTLLNNVGITTVTLSGDTRYDRVSAIAASAPALPPIEAFVQQFPVLIAGSTWPEDEEELDHFCNHRKDLRIIFAPHEISEAHLLEMEKLLKGTIRYGQWLDHLKRGELPADRHVLIIDNIGMLSALYQYASVSYVGGGFGDDGLHNILEPAVWGKPVLFGPVFDRYPEAAGMIGAGGAFSAGNALELEKRLNDLFQDPPMAAAAGEAAKQFIRQHRGATAMIIRYLEENRLLTS